MKRLDTWSTKAWLGSPFGGFRDLLDRFALHDDWPSLVELEQRWLLAADIRTSTGDPLRLVAQPTKSRRARPRRRGDLYDVSVTCGQLPTRSGNWHDFFNVMMFAAFPRTKSRIHARHGRILEERLPNEVERLPGTRTTEQDCLTMLDEGGVLLVADAAVTQNIETLLEAGEHRRFVEYVQDGALQPWLFGHAHTEHLAKRAVFGQPGPLPRAKSVVLAIGAEATRDRIDAALAERLRDPEFCASKDGRRAIGLEDLYVD